MSTLNEKGSLLSSAQICTSEESARSGSSNLNRSSLTALPPVYVDIQEEIEATLDDLKRKMQELKRMH